MKRGPEKTEEAENTELHRVISELKKRGVHLCHVKNGTIQVSSGRHTIAEIEDEGGESIISISPLSLSEFLEVFLKIKRERGEAGGHISFHTINNQITIYGGSRTKAIITETPKLQDISILHSDVQKQVDTGKKNTQEATTHSYT